MDLSDLVPAGVPRGLSRLRRRIAGTVSEGPFLFLGVVLGIALTFRVAIGWAKAPAPGDDPTSRPPTNATGATAAPAATIPTVRAEPAASASATAPATVPGSGIGRKKPRPHVKR